MKGLELARAYYEAYGAEMIHRDFPEWEGKIAVGLAGSGSECFGYDDELSRDHDFEPGFCLFIPGEEVMDRRTAFRLERAYAKLPGEFEGLTRLKVAPAGGSRHGVICQEEFWQKTLGRPGPELSLGDWLTIPEQSLLEATSGEIFRDDEGTFSLARLKLRSMPEDVRLHKLAGCLLAMSQTGQYNYNRILQHGEPAAAALALHEFVTNALHAIFLLNYSFMPYYKWSFRALRDLDTLTELEAPLTELLLTANDAASAERKYALAEEICSRIIEELQNQELTEAVCGDLSKHAQSVHDRVEDISLRNTAF